MTESLDVDKRVSDYISDVVGTDGDVIPSLAASQLVADLRENDPGLLETWLDMHAEAFLRDAITGRIRSVRARARAHAAAGAFARAARTFEQTGDRTVLSPFDVRYVVDGVDTQRRVADMTGRDCIFVAERYEISSNRSRLLSAFHRAVGQRVGDRRVGEVFTETEYDTMYRSITGQPAAIAV